MNNNQGRRQGEDGFGFDPDAHALQLEELAASVAAAAERGVGFDDWLDRVAEERLRDADPEELSGDADAEELSVNANAEEWSDDADGEEWSDDAGTEEWMDDADPGEWSDDADIEEWMDEEDFERWMEEMEEEEEDEDFDIGTYMEFDTLHYEPPHSRLRFSMEPNNGFVMLPVELQEEIMLHCSRKVLANLCLVNKRMCELARSILYRQFSFHLLRNLAQFHSDKLLARNSVTLAQFVTNPQLAEIFTRNLEQLTIGISHSPLVPCINMLQTSHPGNFGRIKRVILETYVYNKDTFPAASFYGELNILGQQMLQNITMLSIYYEHPLLGYSSLAAFVNRMVNVRLMSFNSEVVDIANDDIEYLSSFLSELTITPKSIAICVNDYAGSEFLPVMREFCKGRLCRLSCEYYHSDRLEAYEIGFKSFIEDAGQWALDVANNAAAVFGASIALGSGISASRIPESIAADPSSFLQKLRVYNSMLAYPSVINALDALRPHLEMLHFEPRYRMPYTVISADATRVFFRSEWPRLRVLDLSDVHIASAADFESFVALVCPRLTELKMALSEHCGGSLHLLLLSVRFANELVLRLRGASVETFMVAVDTAAAIANKAANPLKRQLLPRARTLHVYNCAHAGDPRTSVQKIMNLVPHLWELRLSRKPYKFNE
ncbi:hypothetical protein GQ42DRAFT_19474 [Ramicandelaber brevisporus]|nr:hypothetical protein GQ42DRAFT_19474 [Ramicandelaber brevisporus]